MFVQIEVQTRYKVDIIDITAHIQAAIDNQEVKEGICFTFCPHTTAGIVLNENWDIDVEKDIAMALQHVIPDTLPYRHGEGNSPAHIKSVLTGSDHFIFIESGKLKLGKWQGIFLAEFDGPRRRNIWVKLLSEQHSG
ncbi:MAG: YjbQ family protein [Anaerolineae bacterium]|nr:YjbQ family protein [Anaerolineae bacterium]